MPSVSKRTSGRVRNETEDRNASSNAAPKAEVEARMHEMLQLVLGDSRASRKSATDRKREPKSPRTCKTTGCGKQLAKAKGIYCSEACYLKSCKDEGLEPRTCNLPGCSRVAVPGEQGGAKCPPCYAAHKVCARQQLGTQGRACGLLGCGVVVLGEKSKYGAFCSLECGRASSTGRPCATCSKPDVFTGSQSGTLCAECYNSVQAARHREVKRKRTEAPGD